MSARTPTSSSSARLRLPDTEVVSVDRGHARGGARRAATATLTWSGRRPTTRSGRSRTTASGRCSGGCSTRARAGAWTPTSTPSRRGRGPRGAGITVGVVDTGVQVGPRGPQRARRDRLQHRHEHDGHERHRRPRHARRRNHRRVREQRRRASPASPPTRRSGRSRSSRARPPTSRTSRRASPTPASRASRSSTPRLAALARRPRSRARWPHTPTRSSSSRRATAARTTTSQPVTPVRHEPGERPLRRRVDDGRHEGVLLELRREHGRPLRPRRGDRLDVPVTSTYTVPGRHLDGLAVRRRHRRARRRRARRCAAPRSPTSIKATVDHPAALTGLSVTGGRLNAARAVGAATDAPTQPVIRAAQAGRDSATLTMSTREADIASYHVYDASTGAYVTSATSPTITIGGLAAGMHHFVVVARNTSGQDSPTSAVASVVIPAATSSPTAPTTTQTRAGTATIPATTGLRVPARRRQILSRHGRRTLTFRVTRTARVTLTLAKRSGGTRYRTHGDEDRPARVPACSRCRSPRGCSACASRKGAWRVTLGSGSSPTATVAFTRR